MAFGLFGEALTFGSVFTGAVFFGSFLTTGAVSFTSTFFSGSLVLFSWAVSQALLTVVPFGSVLATCAVSFISTFFSGWVDLFSWAVSLLVFTSVFPGSTLLTGAGFTATAVLSFIGFLCSASTGLGFASFTGTGTTFGFSVSAVPPPLAFSIGFLIF